VLLLITGYGKELARFVCHFAHSNQQLQKYYKAFRRLMLRSIQAAMGGNTRTASKHENAETLETMKR
jgi:hypothetical protein